MRRQQPISDVREAVEGNFALAIPGAGVFLPLAMRLAARKPVFVADPYPAPHRVAPPYGSRNRRVPEGGSRGGGGQRLRSRGRLAAEHRGFTASRGDYRIAALHRDVPGRRRGRGGQRFGRLSAAQPIYCADHPPGFQLAPRLEIRWLRRTPPPARCPTAVLRVSPAIATHRTP